MSDGTFEFNNENDAKFYFSSILDDLINDRLVIKYISENVVDNFRVESIYNTSSIDFLIPVVKWAIREKDILNLKTFFLALSVFIASALVEGKGSGFLEEICASASFCAIELLKESVSLTQEQWELLLTLKKKGRRVKSERLAQCLNWDINRTNRVLKQLSCISSRDGTYKELVKSSRDAWWANGV